MNIEKKQIVSAVGLAFVLASAVAKAPIKWVLLMAVAECCIVLVADPYHVLERRLAPTSKALIVTATSLVMLVLYGLWSLSVVASLIAVLVATLLVLAVVRFNEVWLLDYFFLATVEVKQALVSVGDMPHLQAWEHSGKRECDTMLREYLHQAPSPAELDGLYRAVYSLGYFKAQSVADDEIDRWIDKHTRLANKLKALEQATVSKAEYDELVKYYNRVLSELGEWRADAERWSNLYNHKCKAYEQLEKEYAITLADMEALEESLESIDDIEVNEIVKLPSIEERIRSDRAEGMSYGELANKYDKTRSQIQYICSKGVAV